MPNNYTELIAVNDPIEANLMVSTLESQGIDAYLKDENTVNANPMYAQAIGGIRIMVEENQYDIAHQIVQEIRANHTASEEVDEEWEAYKKKAAISGRKASIATYIVAGFFTLLAIISFIIVSIEGCFG